MARAAAFSAPIIDHAPQDFENPGPALDLVQDEQAVFVSAEVELRVRELGPL